MTPSPLPQPPNLDDVIDVAERLDPVDQLRLISTLWASLPRSQRASLSEIELPALLDRLQSSQNKPSKIYSAPRRFDLATILIVTFAYSLLFGAMKALSFPPTASVAIAGFISIVGVGQALLFGGKQPRTASLVVGAFVYAVCMAAAWLISGPRIYSAGLILLTASYTIVGGAILGYLAGTLVGSVFLIADKLRGRLSRNRGKSDLEQLTPTTDATISHDAPES